MSYPAALQEIITFFDALSEDEKRENLMAYADTVEKHKPTDDLRYALVDERKDAECTDRVGVFVLLEDKRHARFHLKLGPQVQTLTRAMGAILCKGLDGCRPEELVGLSSDFVQTIVGGRLVRIRSQTVYYLLNRMKAACEELIRREALGG